MIGSWISIMLIILGLGMFAVVVGTSVRDSGDLVIRILSGIFVGLGSIMVLISILGIGTYYIIRGR